jgi:hypothetical protein
LDASEVIEQAAERRRLFVGEITEAANVTLRLDDQPASIGGTVSHRVHVTGVEQVVLVENASLRRVALTMFLADEALGGR